MNSYVLITDRATHPVVTKYGFWGLGVESIPSSYTEVIKQNLSSPKKPYFSMIADILSTRIGDTVFLYERQVGFHGIYQVRSKPFFDPKKVETIDKTWPLRIELKCLHYFKKPVPEEYLFLSKEYESKFWGWFYRKIQGPRGVNALNPEAAEALTEMLVKINTGSDSVTPPIRTYQSTKRNTVTLPLSDDGKVPLEDILRAWLMANIDNTSNSSVRDVFGNPEDIEWFANNVPYHVSRKNIDILCYHKNMKFTGFPLRYKYSVVELKKDTADGDDVEQVINYSKWVAGRLANSEIETVQPILIAYNFNEKAIIKAKNSDFCERGIAFYKYHVSSGNINFEKFDY